MKKYIITLIAIFSLNVVSLPEVGEANASEGRSINDEIIYDIIIDRFNNGRQAPSEQVDINNPLTYNGGDIKGITLMLDIIEEHGFTAISLSPLMENAPEGYHGYWIEDFFQVEDEFGSIEDLQELVEEAHKREMKVFLELVTNYVAKSSPLVQDEKKSDWFTDIKATPAEATEWLNEVLQFDQTNEEVESYLFDVADYWIDEANIDGYILHGADEASASFLEKLTERIKSEHPKFYLVANSLQGDNIEALCANDNIDAIAHEALAEEINEVFAQVDTPVSQLYETSIQTDCDKMLLYADNKTMARFSNVVADEGRNAVTTWSLALAYLYLTPGTPIVYQGSEVPMYGPGYPENQLMVDSISADPDLKKVFERLSSTRSMFAPLVAGDFEQIATDEGFSLFKRTLADQTVYFGINNDSRSRYVKIDGLHEDLQLRGLFHDDTIRMNDDGEFVVGLDRESAEVFIIQPNIGINWGFIGLVSGIMLLFIISIIFLSIKQRRREV